MIAPASLPDQLRDQPAFGALAGEYARRIFAAQNGDFDVRLCVRNFPQQGLLAEPAEFESLDDAREWAGADPYVEAGVYQYVDVRPFIKALP